MLKELLLVSLLFFQFFSVSSRVAVEEPDTIYPRIAARYILPLTADNPELPSLPLLKTALAGYKLLLEEQAVSRPDVITIIDFSLPSNRERLWVIDLNQGKVLFHCLVSHGLNSGELMAEKFSNIPGSNTSSPGFYTTGDTYVGKHGLSLTLDGLEKGINDKAKARSIVLHGADYVSADFIKKYGRLGRSFGCPAVPVELSSEIIKTIKGGSCLFIYAPEISYISNSHIINRIASIIKV